MIDLSHIDEDGSPSMVDVSSKQPAIRFAHARSTVLIGAEIMARLKDTVSPTGKGSVYETAILAGIMACKRTDELIPLCHSLGLDHCAIVIEPQGGDRLIIDCTVRTTARTGVEMEAMVGASIAALTLYDMLKALSHDIIILETRLIEKRGGKTDFVPPILETPPLKAVILAGGRSKRMGDEKGAIVYHGKPQIDHLAELLKSVTGDVYLSCRAGQFQDTQISRIEDRFVDLGPTGGILSALSFDTDAAWLVVACDLPYLTADALKLLVDRRDPLKIATAFANAETLWPEPLIAIWEPKSYRLLLDRLAQGQLCPRKALSDADVTLVESSNPLWIANINDPAERDLAVASLNSAD